MKTMIGILTVLVLWGFAPTTTHAGGRRDHGYHRGSYTYTETRVSFGVGMNISFGSSDQYSRDHYYGGGYGNRGHYGGGYGRSYPVYVEPVYVEPVRVVPIQVVPIQVVPMRIAPAQYAPVQSQCNEETLYQRVFVGDHYEYRPVNTSRIYVAPSREY
ncbi:MAG: hypothetical protein HQ402_00145 [Parcubacteria group bacterium]|nr:hypothetical protein [Parcubacteria group bacterium]